MIYLQHFVQKIGIITFTLVNSLRRFAILQVLAISPAVLCNFAFCIASCNYNYSVYLVNSLRRFAILQVLAISLAVLCNFASCIALCTYNYSVYLVNSLRRCSILQVLAIPLAVLCNFAYVLHHAFILHNASFNFTALHYLAYFV